MLLPALRAAREKTVGILCSSRMKQNAQIQIAYSSDYKDFFPYHSTDPRMALRNYDVFAKYGITSRMNTKRGPKKAPLLFCPKEHINPWNKDSNGVTYYIWPDIINMWRPNIPWFNTRDVRKPGQKFLLLEVGYTPITPITRTRHYWSSYNVFPHVNKANVAHFDGHVEPYREIMPHFFPTRNGIAEDHPLLKVWNVMAKDYWLYTY